MTKTPLHRLAEHGQSVWIDYLSRDLVESGELMRLTRENAVVGVTTNPTIFQQAISSGKGYEDQLAEEARVASTAKELYLRLTSRDVAEACDALEPVFERSGAVGKPSGRHRDGFVSIEVDPSLAYDTDATTAEAVKLHASIDRPNLLVKIPATAQGLPAIEDMIANGKSINVTLIFSLQRYTEVAEAYLRGLERLVAAGGEPARVSSVASFFVSRVNTETDRRLDEIGGHDGLKGKLAVGNAKLAYRRYLERFAGERWQALAAKGASSQRCLWASTSTKNPAYSDVLYVEQLIGPETVTTLPEKTMHAFQHHGKVETTIDKGIGDAQRLLEQLAKAGVDYDDVCATLEREGVNAFRKSFVQTVDALRVQAAELRAARSAAS